MLPNMITPNKKPILLGKENKILDENAHVYCTKCVYGENLINCVYDDDCLITPCYFCDGFDPQDSKPYKERPYYLSETNNKF